MRALEQHVRFELPIELDLVRAVLVGRSDSLDHTCQELCCRREPTV